LPDSHLGPLIKVHCGAHVRVQCINQLPQPSALHRHGMLVPAAMDG
jgi:FtsP/CotA-like multicopper oxidase with cupredoxin domain